MCAHAGLIRDSMAIRPPELGLGWSRGRCDACDQPVVVDDRGVAVSEIVWNACQLVQLRDGGPRHPLLVIVAEPVEGVSA